MAADWIIFTTGRKTLREEDLYCYNDELILVMTNLGALYMLVFTCQIFCYAIFMWFVFYFVPMKAGMVSRRTVADLEMLGHDSTVIIENEENLKTVVRELEHERKFVKKQIK